MAKKLALIAIGLALFIPTMRVDFFRIATQDETLFASPVRAGTPFSTTYIHSVQLTPVVDEYRIAGGRIWSWEERVQSHNAGLPFDAPEHGRFIVDPPWMIVQGGRTSTQRIAYRVGTESLGRNLWHLPPFDEFEAYKKFPGKRVYLESSTERLYETKFKELR